MKSITPQIIEQTEYIIVAALNPSTIFANFEKKYSPPNESTVPATPPNPS